MVLSGPGSLEVAQKFKRKWNLTCAVVRHCCQEKVVSFIQTVGITTSVIPLPSPHFLPVVQEIGVLSKLFFLIFEDA